MFKHYAGGPDLGAKCGAFSVGCASACTHVSKVRTDDTLHGESVSTAVDWLGILVLRINPRVATQRTVYRQPNSNNRPCRSSTCN